MRAVCFYAALCVLSTVVLNSCNPTNTTPGIGGAAGGGGVPCESRLAGGGGLDVNVNHSSYADKSYGVEIEWPGGSCSGTILLESIGSKIKGHLQTSDHCMREMLMKSDLDKGRFKLAFSVGRNASCKGDNGQQLYFLSVDFRPKTSPFLVKYKNKLQEMKRRGWDPVSRNRVWIENFYVHSDMDTKVYERLEQETGFPKTLVEKIQAFDRAHNKYSCTTNPLLKGMHSSMPAEYKAFRSSIASAEKAQACFIYSDVLFFAVELKEADFTDALLPRCLQGSALRKQNGEFLKLRMGTHLQYKSAWAESLVNFRDKSLQWGLEDGFSREPTQEIKNSHQELSQSFDRIVQQGLRKVEQVISDDGISKPRKDTIYALKSGTPRELKLYTFNYVNNRVNNQHDDSVDKGPYVFRGLELAFDYNKMFYSKPQEEGAWDLRGNIWSFNWRPWGVALILTNTIIDQGASGAIIVSGEDILAALYSKDNEEYSGSGHPITGLNPDAIDHVPNIDVKSPLLDGSKDNITGGTDNSHNYDEQQGASPPRRGVGYIYDAIPEVGRRMGSNCAQ